MVEKTIPPTPSNCEFCGRHHEIMKRGRIGGLKARICADCVIKYAQEIVDDPVKFDKVRVLLRDYNTPDDNDNDGELAEERKVDG